jgi:hypothetical protein
LISRDSIVINTVSGGIVNFGGAFYISPISVSKTVSGTGSENAGLDITLNPDTTDQNKNEDK